MTEKPPQLPLVVTGITPTGQLTIGNYLGSINQLLTLKEDHVIYVFVANLHAITLKFDPQVLWNNTLQVLRLYLASGLDHPNVRIFLQSDVPAHSELGHILLCHTTVGELSRMTQYKSKQQTLKAANQTVYIPTGLLTYPTLMAADILLYNADFVPVGADQKQHIELTRNLAMRLNQAYQTKLFQIPQELTPKISAKIMDLQNPQQKMSKSNPNPKSAINLLDPPAMIQRKIKSAVTDSENKVYYDPVKKPGISNLITIYCAFTKTSIATVEQQFADTDYGRFKTAVAEAIIEKLAPLQTRYQALLLNADVDLQARIKKDGAIVHLHAQQRLIKIKKILGLANKKV